MRKTISRNRPQKALKIARQEQPNIELNSLLDSPTAVNLPCQEYPTPSWFNNSSECDVVVIIPVSEFTPSTAKSIEMMPTRQKPNVGFYYILTGHDDVAIQILKTWEKRKLKRSIGRIFKTNHVGSIFKSLVNEIKSNIVSFLHPESLPDQYWIIPLMKQPRSAPLLVWRHKVYDQCVYSAGVEWHNNKFVHIGREWWNGMIMPSPHLLQNLPKEYRSLDQHSLVDWNGLTVYKSDLRDIDNHYESLGGLLADFAAGHDISILPDSVVTVCNPYFICDSLDLAKFYNKWIASGRLTGQQPKRILVKKFGDRVREAAEVACRMKKLDNIVIFFTDRPEETEGLNLNRVVTDESLVSNRTFNVFYDLDGIESFEIALGID